MTNTAADAAVATTTGRPRTVRNVAFSATAAVVGKITTFVWTVIAARELTRADFGAFNLVLAVALVAASFAEWGFDAALVQRATTEPGQGARLFTEAMTWEAIVAVPAFAACGLLMAVTHTGAGTTLAIAFVLASVFLDSFGDTARTAATAVHRQGATSGALILQRLLTALIAAPVLIGGGGITGLAAALFIGSAIGLVAHLLVLRRLDVVVRMSLVSRRGMRRFVSGTISIGISTLVLAALYRVDVVLLHAFKGPIAVGNYSAAYKLFDTSLFVVFSVNGALFPLMSENADDPRYVARMVESGVATTAVFYLPFAAACLVEGRGILDLLFGSSFGNVSIGALRGLAFAPLAFAFAYLAQSSVLAVRRNGALLSSATIAVVINVALNLVLIPPLSGTGAAIVTTVSYLAEGVVLALLLNRAVGAKVRFGRALAPSVLGSIAFAGVLAVLHLPVLVELAAAVVVGAAVWFAAAQVWDHEQVDVVQQLLPTRRLRQRMGNGRGRATAKHVPVLMYHAVDSRSQEQDPHNLFVKPEAFTAHLDLLAKRGYRALDLDDYLAGLDRGRWPRRSCLITFDDGYESTLRIAAPLLAERGMPAVLFVPGGRIGATSDWMTTMADEPLLDAQELRQLRDVGIEVGVHGYDHTNMAAMSAEELHVNVVAARDRLTDVLGYRPRAFAYPRGVYDDAAVAAVAAAGYAVGFATIGGPDRHALPRIAINSTDTVGTFAMKTTTWWPIAQRVGRASPPGRRILHLVFGYESRPSVDG